MAGLRARTAIVGIGETSITKAAPESAADLARRASLAALGDAGLGPEEVDGMLRFGAPFETVTQASLARLIGVRELSYFGEIPLGGEASAGMLSHAAAAVVSGQATVVLAYRAIKQSGGNRFGRADQQLAGGPPTPEDDVVVPGEGAFTWPYGMMAPAHLFALWATRYMHEYSVSYEELRFAALGVIAIAQRSYASTHPGSLMGGRRLDWRYDAARMISWPLSLFTLCLENDGACAVVVTSSERAGSLQQKPAAILGACQSLAPHREPGSVYAPDLLEIFPTLDDGAALARRSISPKDISVAEMYDASSLMTLLSLELYGFVERGTAWRHVLDVGIGLDSPLPVNTHGGHLSDGYVHGMTGVLEAVRQLRGSAANQVAGAETAFFGGVSGSAVVLGAV